MIYENPHGVTGVKMFMFVRDLNVNSNPESAEIVAQMQLKEGDEVYIMGDGLCSELRSIQRSGPDLNSLQNLLIDLYEAPAEQKETALKNTWSQWHSGKETESDFTIVGFRVE